MNKREKAILHAVKIYTDGAIRPEQKASGLAVIVRDEQDRIRHWWKRREGALTCNEAEYAAVIFAFNKLLQTYGAKKISTVSVYSDSRILVEQMSGRAAAHSPGLRKAMQHLRPLINRFNKVTFHHIPREQNRLADALAFEAVEGLPRESQPEQRQPNLELWEQFETTWRAI